MIISGTLSSANRFRSSTLSIGGNSRAVALGSDFDGIPAAPEGITGSDFYPVLEADLKSRGYTEKRIEKIFNGNFLRVIEAWE